MLTGSTIFTGLINTSDVTGIITQYGYVVAGIVIVLIALAPFALAKKGFGFVLSKASSVFGGK